MMPPRQSTVQDEAEYLLPRPWLSETHWHGQWLKALCLLWEAQGHRRSCWCSGWRLDQLYGLKSIVEETNMVFSWSKTSLPMAVCWITRHFCYRSRKTRERKQNPFMHASGCQSKCPQLGNWGVGWWEGKKEDISGLADTTVSWWLGPKRELAESKTSSISRKVTSPICHQKVLKLRR